MKNEIDLTKLTKEEIERDFVIRCGAPFYFIGKFMGYREIGLVVQLNPNVEAIIRVNKDGKRNHSLNTNYDLIPRPVEKFERDEKVMVSNDGNHWKRRHYSQFRNGLHRVYPDGQTSWSASSSTMSYSKIRKPTPEELAK